MTKSGAKISYGKEYQNSSWSAQCHANLGNLGFQPFGPPDFQKLEESASHHVFMFAFAQLRAESAQNATPDPRR